MSWSCLLSKCFLAHTSVWQVSQITDSRIPNHESRAHECVAGPLLLCLSARTPAPIHAYSRAYPLLLPLTPAPIRSYSRLLPLTPAHSCALSHTLAHADAQILTGEWRKLEIRLRSEGGSILCLVSSYMNAVHILSWKITVSLSKKLLLLWERSNGEKQSLKTAKLLCNWWSGNTRNSFAVWYTSCSETWNPLTMKILVKNIVDPVKGSWEVPEKSGDSLWHSLRELLGDLLRDF